MSAAQIITVAALTTILVLSVALLLIRTLTGQRVMPVAAAACAAALTALLVGIDPNEASNLAIPDGVEYAAGAISLAQEGRYVVTVGETTYPSRYSPWFSLMTLTPLYRLFGPSPGNGILAVTAFSALAGAAAFLIGFKISSYYGGVLAVITLLLLPGFRYFSTQIMPDIPAAALALILSLYFIILWERKHLCLKYDLLATGVIAATAAGFKWTNIFFLIPLSLLPLAVSSPGLRKAKMLALLWLPSVPLLLATLTYNQQIFGDILRTGYHYWLAIPYDYLALTFNVSYAPNNLAVLFTATLLPALLLLAACAHMIGVKIREQTISITLRCMVCFITFSGAPFTFFYLLYFYPTSRFYLPLEMIAAATAGGVFGQLAAPVRSVIFAPLTALMFVIVFFIPPQKIPPNRAAIDEINALTPHDAIIISGLNPAYPKLFPDTRERNFIPISRRIPYASTVITPTLAADMIPRPSDPFEHRLPALLQSGSHEVIPYTALDNAPLPQRIVSALRQRRLFLETRLIEHEEIEELKDRFHLIGISDHLFLLAAPDERTPTTGGR